MASRGSDHGAGDSNTKRSAARKQTYSLGMEPSLLRRIGRLLLGAIVGFVAGAIVAVNLVITAGIEDGYEASPAEVFEENVIVGVAAAIIIIAGPVAGAIVAHRGRSRRS